MRRNRLNRLSSETKGPIIEYKLEFGKICSRLHLYTGLPKSMRKITHESNVWTNTETETSSIGVKIVNCITRAASNITLIPDADNIWKRETSIVQIWNCTTILIVLYSFVSICRPKSCVWMCFSVGSRKSACDPLYLWWSWCFFSLTQCVLWVLWMNNCSYHQVE